MKMGRLIAAAVVLAALGATLFWSNRKKAAQDATAAAGEPMVSIVSLKQEDISKLEIKQKSGDDVVVDRTAPGSDTWKITSPKPLDADHETVSTILYDLSPLKADKVVDQKPGDLKSYGLEPPEVELSATAKDGKTAKLLIGDETPTGGEAYAMVEGDPRLFIVGSTYKNNINKSLMDLRDKRMIPLDFDKLAKIQLTGPKLNLTFSPDVANNGKYIVQDPKNLRVESATLSDIVDKVRLATVDLGAKDEDAKKSSALYSAGVPVATVKVTDTTGASQEMQVRKNKDDYYAKSSAIEGASKVSKDLGDDINKSTDDLREKWLLDLRDDSPDKLELHDGIKSYFLTSAGQDWWSGDGKKMDPLSVENFLNTIRALTATKFVTSGFSNPSISMTVTSNGGKRVEKVQIAKAGNDYLGKREDGSLLYQIDAKSIADMEKAADALKPAGPPPVPPGK